MGLEYYTSERFIHDDLVRSVEAGLPSIRASWKKKQRIEPFFMAWPSEVIQCDDGRLVDGVFLLELPSEKSRWSRLMRESISKTKAYAIALVEQTKVEVLVTFESRHGTKSWHFPIKDFGGTKVLLEPSTKTDTDSIGLLWRAQQNPS